MRALRWTPLLAALALAACSSGGGGGGGALTCSAGNKACGNGCIPESTVCCEAPGAASSSYCTNEAGGAAEGQCFSNSDGRCSAAFPAGAAASYCCASTGSFGSNDCPSGQRHCGMLCRDLAAPCGSNPATCAPVTDDCSDDGECCDGLLCSGYACCKPTGAACGEGECCFGACSGGVCGCATRRQACRSQADCCGELTCNGFSCVETGSLSITTATCVAQGGGEYLVTLAGSASLPVGGELDPQQNTFSATPVTLECAGWTADSFGCERQEGQPATADWTWSFKVYPDSGWAPQVVIKDSVSYLLDSKTPTLDCQ